MELCLKNGFSLRTITVIDKQIKAVTGRYVGVSAFECEDCGREIPESAVLQ